MPIPLAPVAVAGVRWAATRAIPSVARWAGRRLGGRAGAAGVGAAIGSASADSSGGPPNRRSRRGYGGANSRGNGGGRSVPPTRNPAGGPMHNMPEGDWTRSVLDKNWAAGAVADNYDRLLDRLSRNLPQFVHSIAVTVQGGPQADLRRTYYLALAAAFGRYRNGVRGSIGNSFLKSTTDVTGKAVGIEIGYTTSATWEGVRALGRITRLYNSDSALRVIEEGPSQVTIGGDWPAFLTHTGPVTAPGSVQVVGGIIPTLVSAQNYIRGMRSTPYAQIGPALPTQIGIPPIAVPGCSGSAGPIPTTVASGDARIDALKELINGAGSNRLIPWGAVRTPGNASADFATAVSPIKGTVVLPDEGRIITTGEKNDPRIQSPRPALDGSTRSSLVSLVAQSLSSPCFLPESPPCTAVPAWGPGVKVQGGSDDLPYNRGALTVIDRAPTAVDDFGGSGFFGSIIRSLFGPDGYFRGATPNPNLKR